MASRKATSRIAEALAAHEGDAALAASLPPKARLSRFSSTLLFSDFLDPPEAITARINELAGTGVHGHLVQILDPAEEALAYEGRIEFRSPEGGDRWVADRVETLRPAYQARLAAHRAQLEHVAWPGILRSVAFDRTQYHWRRRLLNEYLNARCGR